MTMQEIKINNKRDNYHTHPDECTFYIEINKQRFVYLQTNKKRKETTIKNWQNRFWTAFELDNVQGANKLALMSIEGISFFNPDFTSRRDINLGRLNYRSKYHEIRKLHQSGKIEKLEKEIRTLYRQVS